MTDKVRVHLRWLDGRYVPMQALSPMSGQAWEAAADETRERLERQRAVKTAAERGEEGWRSK